jgi:pimeloyl-ACP methyl ester carboxylesterase
MLTGLGYAALRFDFRGCGESEGGRGRVICKEQVKDTRNALSFLARRGDIHPERIGVVGQSFGAAVAVYAAGVDRRIAACISSGGWGDGAKKFRRQHASAGAWAKFSAMVKEGKRRRRTGKAMRVSRYDIVPIPPRLRGNLAPGSIMEFPFEVVESMLEFNANEVVGKISPRPLCCFTPRTTPSPYRAIGRLFERAGKPTDFHLIADVDHFMFSEGNTLVVNLVRNWLDKHFPPRPDGHGHCSNRAGRGGDRDRRGTHLFRDRHLHRRRFAKVDAAIVSKSGLGESARRRHARIMRVPRYVDLIENGDMNPKPAMRILPRPSVVLIEADRAAGPVAMMRGVSGPCSARRRRRLALVRATTHTAALGYYTWRSPAKAWQGSLLRILAQRRVSRITRRGRFDQSISIAVPGASPWCSTWRRHRFDGQADRAKSWQPIPGDGP